MLVWLLVLFLLISVIYVVFKVHLSNRKFELDKYKEHHYTFKI